MLKICIASLAGSFSGSFTDRKHGTGTPDQLWQCVEASWSAVPQEHIQSLFESMPRREQRLSPRMAATDSGRNHTSQKFKNLII
ncbi:hypothetical protein TNCV_2010611 [Trichonephila clavipes]|nr:hypothetical protein TNCV_2010611 [Trichonephila clavipes]